MTAEWTAAICGFPVAAGWRGSVDDLMLLPEKGPPLKHLRQKRHRAAAAVQDKHLSTGIIVKFGDNEKP